MHCFLKAKGITKIIKGSFTCYMFNELVWCLFVILNLALSKNFNFLYMLCFLLFNLNNNKYKYCFYGIWSESIVLAQVIKVGQIKYGKKMGH